MRTLSGNEHLFNAAAKTGQKDIIELLIVAGANVNAKDFENKTPLG